MNADMNPRGGLTVDRDSLHASSGYARQVEAAKQLQERRVNADVEKAVELAEVRNEMRGDSGRYPNGEGDRLREEESNATELAKRLTRQREMDENSMALLWFLLDRFGSYMDESDKRAITAHLGGEHE